MGNAVVARVVSCIDANHLSQGNEGKDGRKTASIFPLLHPTGTTATVINASTLHNTYCIAMVKTTFFIHSVTLESV